MGQPAQQVLWKTCLSISPLLVHLWAPLCQHLVAWAWDFPYEETGSVQMHTLERKHIKDEGWAGVLLCCKQPVALIVTQGNTVMSQRGADTSVCMGCGLMIR